MTSPTDHTSQPAFVVDTTDSPRTLLRPVPLAAVTLRDRFWEPRRRTNQAITLPSQYQLLEETGRIDNFRRAAGRKAVPFRGMFFNDSDVYKWLEGVAWTLAATPDAGLAAMVDTVIDEIAAAQQPNGYLNSYFMFERAGERWTNFDLHELYCAGHLFQAAVAHHRATRQTTLLDVATRLADHICDTLGPAAQGKLERTGGHPEIELALVELFRATGNRRYLEQAQFFVDARGRGLVRTPPNTKWNDAYYQDHTPLRAMDRMIGHAVRHVYLNAGAADICAEADDAALHTALETMWQRMVTRQIYVSGGIGARYEGEAFGDDYELPNARAYTETCAAIGNVMWSWRMLALDGDARYADLIEHTLYNAILPGLSLDGENYFYQNPLADDGSHRREPWFDCACCPPNLARFLPSMPSYFYSTSEQAIWIHQYAASAVRIELPDGRAVTLTQQTNYPWDGDITIDVAGEGEFGLKLRVPAWCENGATLTINDEPFAGALTPGSYATITRAWAPGDRVALRLPMPVRHIAAHPRVTENTGRVALMRGPLLYCVEQVDNPGVELSTLAVPRDAVFTATFAPDLLGGVVTLHAQALAAPGDAGWSDQLYRAVSQDAPPAQPAALMAVPYYAWANREAGPMLVWLREG